MSPTAVLKFERPGRWACRRAVAGAAWHTYGGHSAPIAPRWRGLTAARAGRLRHEGLPPKGIMKLRYVTNPCCAVPELRSKLAENTLIGGGKTDLIPQDRVRPPTPEHLKSRFTGDEEEEKVFAGVRPTRHCAACWQFR